jgi:hypothetical protein
MTLVKYPFCHMTVANSPWTNIINNFTIADRCKNYLLFNSKSSNSPHTYGLAYYAIINVKNITSSQT